MVSLTLTFSWNWNVIGEYIEWYYLEIMFFHFKLVVYFIK